MVVEKLHLHYISSPAGLIAIVVRENGSDSFYYTYTDHLGSILTVTNSSGAVVAEQSFDAWGRRRNPTSWVTYASATEAGTLPVWLYRGYTGHEQLDRFGLINMNGRLYDPTLGRVLSPDNYVQDPFNTQSFNRYSYAFNNPLKYSDPSGQLFILDNLILGAVGGLFNLVTNLGSVQNGWQALGYFGVGFVAGYGQIAASGAILAAGNAALGGATPGQIALSAVTGAVTSMAGAQLGSAVAPYLKNMLTDIASPVLRQGLTNLVAGGAVGGLIGGGVAALSGNNILAGMGSGAQMGALSGALNGVAGGLIQAGRNGVNPWTGKLRTDFSTTEFPSGNSYTIPHEAIGVTANGNGGRSIIVAPSGWILKPSNKGGGGVYTDPTNPHNNIRQMPGNPNSPNPAQQNPYVIYKRNGVAFDVNGNPLPTATHPDAHIPMSNFNINRMPKF